MENFQNKVSQTISKYNLINPGDRIVVGLSGGADSCVLLHCLAKLCEDKQIHLIAAHLHHSIRDTEANRDLVFSEQFAHSCSVEFVSKRENVPLYAKNNKISEEMAGRELRYAFFEEICAKYNCNKIAVAHNKNDCAETILLNLTRGSGSEGIEGIKPKNGKIIRPIIEISRSDIEEYARVNNIAYVTDSTNLTDVYARNIIRNQIIPELSKINPGVIDNIIRFSEIIGGENSFFDEYIENSKLLSFENDNIIIDRATFSSMHYAMRRRMILSGIKKLCGSTHNVSLKQIDGMCQGIKTGNVFKFANKSYSLVTNEHILITRYLPKDKNYAYNVSIPGIVEIKETNTEYKFEYVTKYHNKENTIYLSADNICDNLIVRSRMDGDSFIPYGMKGRKKVKSFFIDSKIPSHERFKYPLLLCGNEICAILPLRIADNYKVSKDTKKILMITKLTDTYDEK